MSSSQLGAIFASLLASQTICDAQETFLLFTRSGGGGCWPLVSRGRVLQYLGQPPITKNIDSLPPCLLKVCIVCFLPFSCLISDACLIYSPTPSSELVSPPPTTLVLYFILSDVCVYYFYNTHTYLYVNPQEWLPWVPDKLRSIEARNAYSSIFISFVFSS